MIRRTSCTRCDCSTWPVEGELRVRRENRDFLLRVRNGDFSYEELVERTEVQLAEVQSAFERSPLPDEPFRTLVSSVLVAIREEM